MNRFFRSTTKGEAGEIRDDINSEEKHRQKQALTKIIAGMTLGRDMSNVFPDVVRLMGTNAVDIKKLVYLYLMQYATGMPEKAILVAGSIARDTMHPSPLIRGLAIRTMSSITTERMMECAVEPLRRCLKEDHDPYVHRCAVMAILKMYNTSRNVCEGNGFLPLLMEQFSSGNATVVATVASVVRELHQLRGSEEGLEVTPRIATTLQNALPEANEWGQISILELLSNYVPLDREEAELICDRVLPWLQHGNSSIVLTTVKIIVNYLDNWCDSNAPGASEAQKEEKMRRYGSKLAPALVSLVTSHAMEIRYVVLRNVNLIARKFPDLLVPSLRIFYVKYNDPIYVKLEKLEILSMLANKNNVEQLLSECVEYAQEVDIEFVRKAVRTIGFLALKIDVAAAECVQQLVHLVKTKVNYIVQEAIVVIRDIFRRYPNQYESIISVLCENLETLDEPEAKSAMIWIVGEYADRIENAMELLEIFTDTFEEEIIPVRMTILGAVVKLYLKRGEEAEGLLQTILKECTESDIPDLRDRAFLYWRLLTTDAEVAAQTILSQREIVSTDTSTKYDRQLLSHLLKYIGTLSSVYHKPPQNLFTVSAHSAVSVRTLLGALLQYDEEEEEEENAGSKPNETGGQESGGGKSSLDFLDVFSDVPSTSGQASSQPTTSTATTQEMPFAAKSVPKAAAGATFDDLFAGPQSSHPPLPPPPQQQQQQQHPSAPGVPCTAPGRVASTLDDFLSDLTQPSHGAPTTLPEVPMSQDPFSFPPPVPKTPALPCVLTAGQSGGLGIYGRLRPVQPTGGFDASCSVALELEFCNETSPAVPIQNIALQMNRNPFGFTLRETLKIEETITPAGRKTICVELRHVPANVTPAVQPLNVKALPFAVKSSLTQVSVAYFSLPVHVGSLLFATANTMSQDAFSQGWMNTPNTNVRNVRVTYNAALYPLQLMIEKLFDELSLKFVVERTGLHFFAGLVGGCRAGAPGGNYCLVGVRTDATSGQLDVVVKCNDLIVLNIVEYAIQGLFVM